jgi:hypothetical protein
MMEGMLTLKAIIRAGCATFPTNKELMALLLNSVTIVSLFAQSVERLITPVFLNKTLNNIDVRWL